MLDACGCRVLLLYVLYSTHARVGVGDEMFEVHPPRIKGLTVVITMIASRVQQESTVLHTVICATVS